MAELLHKTIVHSKTFGNAPASHQGLPMQNYEKIKAQCLAKKTLFEDPFFPLDDNFVRSHLLNNNPPITHPHAWKRPKGLADNPQFITRGISPCKADQGIVGDCLVLAAIGSLTQYQALFDQVVPPNQTFDDSYCGIFHFRFWYFGEWVDIVVDDKLPFIYDNQLIFLKSKDPNEFWCALLEKAYAKLYGGYKYIEDGSSKSAMEDFTGGVVQSFHLRPEYYGLFETIERTLNLHMSLLTCSIQTGDAVAQENGLVTNHAYSVIGTETVQADGNGVQLLCIRNPWGEEMWTGDWSNSSDKWGLVPDDTKSRLLDVSKRDGVFWISFDDFCENFTNFELGSAIEHLNPDAAVKRWSVITKSGRWLNSNQTAGGCPSNRSTFVKNPQFLVELTDSGDGDGKCSCIIALTQKYRYRQGLRNLSIGFFVYHAPDDGSGVVTQDYIMNYHKSEIRSRYDNVREMLLTERLDPGKYVIVPSTFEPYQEGEFLLRVFIESSRVMSATFSLICVKA